MKTCTRNPQTVAIEQMLQEGHSVSATAREFGTSRQWVGHIKKRLIKEGVLPPATPGLLFGSDSNMKVAMIKFTPTVFDALVEATAIANRKDSEEPITVTDYVEECEMIRLVELGLLRKRKQKHSAIVKS